jgi:hypothetical protein
MKHGLYAVALVVLFAGMPTRAVAECPGPPSTLSSQQRDQAHALRSEQQADLDRARARGLPADTQLRQYELTIEQRADQKYLHDQQQLEQGILNRRSATHPGQSSGAQQPSQNQRYRLEDAEQQQRYRMQRDQR